MLKKIALVVVILLTLYVAAYGFARWRKFIVMHETIIKEEQMLVRFTEAGWDVRDNWRGHTKNRPLEYVEDTFRGFKKPLDLPKREPSQ